MSDPLKHIENFIREKLAFLEQPEVSDWQAFERKLARALFFRRLKIYTSLSVLVAAMAWLSWSENSPLPWLVTESNRNLPASTLDREAHKIFTLHAPPSPKKTKVPERKSIPAKIAMTMVNPVATEKILPLPARDEVSTVNSLNHEPNIQRFTTQPAQLRKPFAGLTNRFLPDAESFLELRTPGYSTEPEPSTEPYISPLQEKNPWSYTINVYPNFTFRRFKVDPNKTAYLHSDFVDEMQDNHRSGFSLNIGLEVSRRIGNLTYVNTGIEYITTSYETNFDFVNFRDAILDPETGEITGYEMKDRTENVKFSGENQYHYLNFPLSISYQPWANKHLRLNLEAGASIMYFMRAEGTTIDYRTLDQIDLSSQDYRNTIGSFSLKIGAQYFVTPKVNIGFEPTLMYFTNTIYAENYPFEVIPYSVGLNFNLQVKLN